MLRMRVKLHSPTPPIAGQLFNGLTANDHWHQIYRSQQRSLFLGKGLMLAETVAQTDGQALPIFIYRLQNVSFEFLDSNTVKRTHPRRI